MIPLVKSLLLSGALFAGSAVLCAAEETTVTVAPPDRWKPPGEGITLKERDGLLEIQFDVDVKNARRIQQKTVFEEERLILLREPAAVRPEQARVLFDIRGQDGSAETRDGTVFLRPVLEDESGERFSYEPYRRDTLKLGGADGWTEWTTRPFLTSEAGGASPNIYAASGGNANTWPDGDLHLIGFELRIRINSGGTETGRRKGRIFLDHVRLAPLRLATNEASAFADAFLQKKGDYVGAFEIRPGFQEAPIAEFSLPIHFDPQSEKSRRQRVTIPVAGDLANSWIRYRWTRPDGEIISEGDLRWETDRSPDTNPLLPPKDPTRPPSLGRVRVNPMAWTNGVYPPGAPWQVTLRIFNPEPLEVRWKLRTYAFGEPLAEGKLSVATEPAAEFRDAVVALEPPAEQTAFRFDYTLVKPDGREIDRGSFVLGRGGDIAPNHDRAGLLPDRAKIKKEPYNRITFHDGNAPRDAQDVLRRFTETLDDAGEFTNHVTYMIDLAQFEVLPGVYDFRLLDAIMNAAADRRFGVTVRLAHAETKAPFLWLPFTKVRDFDGSIIGGHPLYKAVSMADGSYLRNWVKAFHALYDRYREHPAFEGYYLMMPGGEWILPDEVWHGKIADYSWGATRAFRDYLRQDLGLSLDALNTRWTTTHSSWDEVLPPIPDWRQGTAPDLRPQWRDFSRFKLKLIRLWCLELGRRIRDFDDRRVIISYGLPTALIDDDGSKPIDYAHNGGNHFLKNAGQFIAAWDNGRGIGWITEPHHPHRWAAYGDPAQKGWVLDWSVFVMLSQAGAGGANLHVYYFPNPTYSLVAHYGGEFAYDRMEQFKPILRELHGMDVVAIPPQTAAFHDSETLLTKHRTTFVGRESDLMRWFELLTADSVPWEPYVPEHADKYRVIFLNPLDEVLSGASIDALDRSVRQGSTLVLSARAGQFNSDAPGETYALLTRLGIAPPEKNFETGGEKMAATVEPAFRDLLGRDSIQFYSQKDLIRELQDPAIGADFFRWPYRWLPQSDYFGYFPGQQVKDGEVLARFPDGGAALSRHRVGKGQVLVFWGTPDMTPDRAAGLVGALNKIGGAQNPKAGDPIPYLLEGRRNDLDRNYALLYQETPGTYRQKLLTVPDGDWFIDDMVSSQKLGTWSGRELRETGVEVTFQPGVSPLKVLRLSKAGAAKWQNRYPVFPSPSPNPSPTSH